VVNKKNLPHDIKQKRSLVLEMLKPGTKFENEAIEIGGYKYGPKNYFLITAYNEINKNEWVSFDTND
jgi:hypothetical protein